MTGATGFIGRHMAAYLAEQGCEVVSLQRSHAAIAGISQAVTLSDLQPLRVAEALRGRRFDWIVHFAGYGVSPDDRNPDDMFFANVELPRSLVQLAPNWHVKAVFIAGTGSEYDTESATGPVLEDHPLELTKLYGASKAAGTICAHAMAKALGLPLAIGRIFKTYGPGEPAHRLLPTLLHNLKQGNRVKLSPGLQLRDQLFVHDVVTATEAMLMAVEVQQIQVIANVATGKPETVRHFAEIVAEEIGVSTDLLGFGDIAQRPDDTMCFSGNPQRLISLTGWQPRFDLRSGIRESIAYFAN